MYPVTITIHNDEEMGAVLAAFGKRAKFAATNTLEPAKPEPDAKKPGAKEPPAQSSGTAKTPQESSAPSATGESKGYTIDDAKALTMKIVSDKGRDAAVDLLKKYGVPVAAKLAADQIQGFCVDAELVLAS